MLKLRFKTMLEGKLGCKMLCVLPYPLSSKICKSVWLIIQIYFFVLCMLLFIICDTLIRFHIHSCQRLRFSLWKTRGAFG